MHATDTLRHWVHSFHDNGLAVAHFTGRLLHEKSFWGIFIAIALLGGLLALIALLGGSLEMQNFTVPYGRYY